MKKIVLVFIFILISIEGASQIVQKKISGIVTNSEGSLYGVTVQIKNSDQGTTTDKEGKYSIKARINDTLVFSFQGMRSIETIIEENTNSLNIFLSPKIEEIGEVVLKKRIFYTQQELLSAYPSNNKLIKTSRGILDKDRSSFSYRIIDGEKLLPIGTDFLYSLQNLIPNMIVDRTDFRKPIYPAVYLQKQLSYHSDPTAIFDVDGFIYVQPPTYIQVSDIDRIAVLTGSGAVTRYGSQGAGGVIIVNTKSKNWMDEKGIKRTYDNSDLIDSIQITLDQGKVYIPTVPNYIEDFRSSKSSKKAYKIFQKHKHVYGDSPYYYLNVASYFIAKWENDKIYLQILKELNTNFPNDITALKALAYTYENAKLYEKSLAINLQILKLKPVEAQSYINLANTYTQLEKYQLALKIYNLYKRADSNIDTLQFDKFGVDNLMFNQINYTLLKLNNKNFPFTSLTNKSISNQDTRIVLEWNNKSAEFEIEYTNNHTNTIWSNFNNQSNELLLNQKIKGYSSKQFFINKDKNPNWMFKVKYYGNKTPTYLKVTTYFNFENPNSNKKIMIFNLSEQAHYAHLFTLNLNSMSMW